MPELPEVETIRRQLDAVLKGKVIAEVEVLREKSFSGDTETLIDNRIESVERKSKVIEVIFADNTEMVIVHLKMTGQLIFVESDEKTQEIKNSRTQNREIKIKNRIVGGHPTPDWVNDLPSKHTRVIWTFMDGSKLYFNDMRVFGWMRVVSRSKYESDKRKQVPDITDKEFTRDYLFDLLKRSKKVVKLVLLDQDKVGGLGNIYVNDALFIAGIRPDRKADELDNTEVDKLYEAIIKVIYLGIKYGGASASNYVQVSGLGGTYQDHFQVYKKEGEKCSRCGKIIKKIKLGGRGTFYCPQCQK